MHPFTLSREEVRELDRRAINEFGVPGIVLMENAGRGCAELLMRLNPERKLVVGLCGGGNNGGDGFVIARHLDNHGWPVMMCLWSDSDGRYERFPELGFSPKLTPDADTNLSIWVRSGRRVSFSPQSGTMTDAARTLVTEQLRQEAWVVDALFGTGLNRALGPPFDELVALVNASGNPVLAIDVPSGLDCDTGVPLGPTIQATHTATFVAHKRGFLNPESLKWTGGIHAIDIGVPRMLVDEYRGSH
jgi:NAD(P)H-hydrate epimerase